MTGSAPVVPSIPAGYGPLPADFNSWVQAPFASLTSRVVFRAAKTTSQTLAAGNNTIQFDSILEDPYSGWNASTYTWTPPAAWSGTYIVRAGIVTGGNAGGRVGVLIGLNGTAVWTLSEVWASTSQANMPCGEAPVQLVGGQDQVSVIGYSAVGVNLDTTAGQQCTVELVWYSN